MTMTAEGRTEVFLSCFKCGRIVRSSDTECPRCGLQFGPGTLFECPFCCGLVWRNATTCSTCGIDLTKFSEGVEKTSKGFSMDKFVDTIITTEVEQIKSTVRRVSCPGCGLMIRGDESKCPRCDLPLEEAQVDCPVCGEKTPASSKSCVNCGASFEEGPKKHVKKPVPEKEERAEEEVEFVALEIDSGPTKRKTAKPKAGSKGVSVKSKVAKKSKAAGKAKPRKSR